MALQTNKKEPFLAVITNLSRIALAVVLIISGFVKAVDPMGLCYKLEEYLAAFGVESITPGWLMLVAILLCAAEFITGVLLLMGVYRRLVVTVTFLFFLFFRIDLDTELMPPFLPSRQVDSAQNLALGSS